MRFRLTIAYDGAGFCGWQSQSTGRSVQEVIEEALMKIEGGPCRLHGAGRTDAGVHAKGQCAHFDTGKDHAPEVWLRSLNANLPADVRIIKVQRVPSDFHARFSASAKVYAYQIWNGPVLSPLERGRAWHVPHALCFERLGEAAFLFEGEHDFRSFCAKRGNSSDGDTVRRIEAIKVSRRGTMICVRFEGAGFLYKMVRMLVAAMVQSASGRVSLDTWKQLLENPSRDGKGQRRLVAPAEGLYLVRVKY